MIRKSLLLIVFLVVVSGCNSQTKEELLQEGTSLSEQGNALGAVVLFNSALEKDPNYVEARYQLGLAYLASSKFSKAEKEFQKVLLQDPSRSGVHLDLANLHLQTNQPDAAFTDVENFLKVAPKNSRSQEYLGRVYGIRGDFDQAEQLFRESFDLDDTRFEPGLALAQVYLYQKRPDAALSQLEGMVQKFPKNKNIYYLLARLTLSQGNKDKALEYYKKIIEVDASDVGAPYMAGVLSIDAGDLAQGDSYAKDLTTRFPAHPAGERLLGLLEFTRGNNEEAAVHLRKSLQKMSDLSGHYFLGLTELKLGRPELALNQFQQAVDINPTHVQSRVMAAMTLLRQKRIDECLSEVGKALELDPQNAVAYNIRGSALLARGDFDAAMEDLNRAVELDPALADAHMKKGLFNLAKGNAEAAGLDLSRAIAAAPEVPNLRLMLSSLYLKQQNFAKAVEALQEGLTGSPEDALLLNYQAAALFAQKKNDEALAALQKAKTLKPDYFTPYFNLASWHLAQGDYESATGEYRAILAVDPVFLKALFQLGSIQEMQGDFEGAQKSFETARQGETPEGYLGLAAFYDRNKDRTRAEQVLEAGYQAHPAHPAILEARARMLIAKNDLDGAAAMYQALEKVKPGSGLSSLAAVWLKQGKGDDAVALAQETIEGHPDSPYGYALLAVIQASQKNPEAAEAALKKGIDSARNRQILELQLAQLYARSGKTALAITTLEGLEREFPRYAPALFTLATIVEQQGDKRRAVELYQQILSNSGDYVPALNNLAYLYADNYGRPKEALELAIKAFRGEPNNPGVMDTMGYALLRNDRADEAVKLLNKAAEALPGVTAVRLHQGEALLAVGQAEAASEALKAVLEKGTEAERARAKSLLEKLSRK